MQGTTQAYKTTHSMHWKKKMRNKKLKEALSTLVVLKLEREITCSLVTFLLMFLQDDEMKREADAVLSEVTRRQSDGRRQIALLEALQKLHQARIQTLEGRGSKLTAEDLKDSDHSELVFGEGGARFSLSVFLLSLFKVFYFVSYYSIILLLFAFQVNC